MKLRRILYEFLQHCETNKSNKETHLIRTLMDVMFRTNLRTPNFA